MHYVKLAMAAGASIVAAAQLSPAYALPPVMPLDLNGPIRQGHMCIAPYGHRYDTPYGNGQYYDTGPGYNHFYDCGPERPVRYTHQRHYEYRPVFAAVVPAERVVIRPAVYRPLDINGPVRQGDMCIVHNSPYDQTGYGYWSSHFEPCPPRVLYVGYHRHALAHHHRHASGHHHHRAHTARLHHRKALHHAQTFLALSCDTANEVDLRAVQQFWQPTHSAQAIDTVVDVVAAGGLDPADNLLAGADFAGAEPGSVTAIRNAPDDAGLLTQLFEDGPQPDSGLGRTHLSEGVRINHSAIYQAVVGTLDGVRRNRLPPGNDDRQAPIAPALLSMDAFGPGASDPGSRPYNKAAADQIALTRADYSSPAQSDAAMPVAANITGAFPLGAALGLALIVAAPLVLVATQLTVADKAAAIETVSDPVAEWYIPGANTIVADQRIAAVSHTVVTAPSRCSTGLD